MLTVTDLQIAYEDFSFSASFSAAPSEMVVVTGPSGSGKSTLLALLAGFLIADSGEINLYGENVTELRPAKRNMMTIFQSDNIFSHLTVSENVALGISPSVKQLHIYQPAVDEALEKVGLSGFQRRLPEALSGGQQQRVAIARALLSGRKVWLFDEPFSALGPSMRQQLQELVAEMTEKQHLITIMVTHQPLEVGQADKLLFLDEGKIVVQGEYQKIIQSPPEAVAKYL